MWEAPYLSRIAHKAITYNGFRLARGMYCVLTSTSVFQSNVSSIIMLYVYSTSARRWTRLLTSIPIPKVCHVQLASPNIAQFGPMPNIGTLAFDTQQDLLWVGDNHVSS